jgi:hypothetical protein
VLDIPLTEVNALCKLIPSGPNVELDNVFAIPEVKTALESSELNRKWLKIARTLEGLTRQPGVHAAVIRQTARNQAEDRHRFTLWARVGRHAVRRQAIGRCSS